MFEHKAKRIAGACAHCDAHANFVRSAAHGVRHHAINSSSREHNGHNGKKAEHLGKDPPPRNPLGLKFLQVTPGNSDDGFEAGETIPVTSAKPEPVDIDEFFSMFDKPTRDAIRQNLAGFGNALAGRGPQLNEAIGALRRAAVSGQPILRKIVEPSTNFAGFWRALEALSATVAPVAETQATMFRALDTTFAAFARVSRPYIQETIEKSPPTLDEVNADLPALRPFLEDSARFFTALRPGAAAFKSIVRKKLDVRSQSVFTDRA